MSDLTERDVLFISHFLTAGCNGPRAAIMLGSSPRSASKTANKFLARAEIQTEIARRTQEIASASAITVQSLIKEAEEARSVAQAMGNSAGMTQAIALKGKLSGLLTDRPIPSELPPITVIISSDDAGLL